VNPRATIFLLVLTLAAVGFVFYLNRSVLPTREAEENRRYAVVFEPERVSEIDITRAGGKTSLRKETGGWRISEPFEDRASPESVDRLIMAARLMEVRDRQPGRDPEKFPEAALVPPRLRIELRGGETAAAIDIGAGTALPGEVFARVDGKPGVLRVADTIVELAGAAPETFRDPRLTELISDDIEKFTVRRADGEMTLRRERGRWMIERPVRAPADARAVREFLDPLLGLRVKTFGIGSENPAATLPAQEASISLTPRGGGEDVELRVNGPEAGNPDSLAAFFESRGGEIAVDKSAEVLFSVSPEQLRDRSLGYADLDTVDRIRLESEGKKVTLRREGENWIGVEDKRKRNASDIEKLIATFNDTRVGTFRTAETAESVGLAAPPQKIVFYSWLSENTAEDAAGASIIAGADLGHAAPDGSIYARSAGKDETVTVPATLSEAIRAVVSQPAAVNSPR
jgi:hypothetical protein